MKVLVTGGAGFIGSHVAEFYAKNGEEVRVLDNLSRASLLKKNERISTYNWNRLKEQKSIEMVKGDIRDRETAERAARDADLIVHAAAQTAVTTSVSDPRTDFETNALGTFNLLEAARKSGTSPTLIYCSTNKVYGNNVNTIPIRGGEKRYEFSDPEYGKGVPERFSTDHCEHTPYGCSKYLADVYIQDYARRGIINAGVFRMSCIYGTHQFGVEDQGWVAWFTIATLLGKPLTIYGDGKQVRDVLFIDDLVRAFDSFARKGGKINHNVFNMGGGMSNTISLLELIDILEKQTGKKSEITYSDWRPSDQKVYISDISRAKKVLGWEPKVSPAEGIGKLIGWVKDNEKIIGETFR